MLDAREGLEISFETGHHRYLQAWPWVPLEPGSAPPAVPGVSMPAHSGWLPAGPAHARECAECLDLHLVILKADLSLSCYSLFLLKARFGNYVDRKTYLFLLDIVDISPSDSLTDSPEQPSNFQADHCPPSAGNWYNFTQRKIKKDRQCSQKTFTMHIFCFKKCGLWQRMHKRQALETGSPCSLFVSTLH